MKRSFLSSSRAVVLALALVSLTWTGCVTRPTGPPPEPTYSSAADRASAHRRVLEQVWRHVERRFYSRTFNGADWATALARYAPAAETAASTDDLYAVINEMLAELRDAHTAALTPSESWSHYTAARALVGLSLERMEDQWVVVEVREQSPAARAGVQPGWVAVSRNGEPLPVDGISFINTPGETYTWAFLDGADQPRTLPLTAEVIADWRPPEERLAEAGWVYLRFDEFEADYQRWLRDRLRAHRHAPGVVLDLRQNGGGAVASLERIINDFFPKRVAYGTFVTRGGREDHERSAWLGGANYAGPLVVLVGEGSASSSEILAHVLQHYGRATLIGRPTAGVVIASQYYRLADGGELQIGTYDYRTPDGTRLEGRGVQPDIVVSRSLPLLRAGRDADLEAAVAWLEQQRAPHRRPAAAAAESSPAPLAH